MQNTEPYKREPVLQAFVSLELIAAVVGMCFFWFTIVSFDSSQASAVEKVDNAGVTGDIMDQVNNMKAMQLVNAGQLVQAEREASALVQKKPHNAAANICAGNIFLMAGATDDGLRYLKKGVALSHRNKDVILNYAQRLAQAKHYDDAIAQYNSLIALSPESEVPHMELAQIYFDQKKYADAADQWKQVCALNSNNFAARKLRGIALARSNKLKLGLEEYMHANAQEQQYGPPEALKQMLGTNGQTKVDRVVFELQQQINNKPDEYVPKLRLAQLYTYGGNAKDAKELLIDARRLAPSNPEVQRTLAVVMKQLGEDNQALSAFAISIKLEEQQEKERLLRSTNQ